MTTSFDPKKAMKSVKRLEGMLAFVAFDIRHKSLGSEPETQEGFIKISSVLKQPPGGYLSLTFLIDTENRIQKETLQAYFGKPIKTHIKSFMGDSLEKIVFLSLDELGEIENWIIQEMKVHVRHLSGYEKTIIEKDLLPAIEDCTPFSFKPVEWWPQDHEDRMLKTMSDRMKFSEPDLLKRIVNWMLR